MDLKICKNKRIFLKLFAIIILLLSSAYILFSFNSPYCCYIPILLIATSQWYKSYETGLRSFYGLFRLLLFIIFIILWNISLYRLIMKIIVFIFDFDDTSSQKISYLFPYVLMVVSFARIKDEMSLNDKRRYFIHVLYDIPAFMFILFFKALNKPLNSLYNQISTHCYLGCMPIKSDVRILNEIGIEYVINMCAEYKGPYKIYKTSNIYQLHLPTIDTTAPSLETIEKAIEFMKSAHQNKKKVFVHCKTGISRSATIVLCHLVANENMSPENAMNLMKEKRPEVVTNIMNYTSVLQFFSTLKNK